MRYFAGIVPPVELSEAILRLQRMWPGNRLPDHVEPHITVKSPLALTQDRSWIKQMEEVCQTQAVFNVRLGAPAFFRKDVLFLSVESDALQTFHNCIQAALASVLPQAELAKERQSYIPHLTIGMRSFGLSQADLAAMAQKAPEILGGPADFQAVFLRVFEKEEGRVPYRKLLDLPLKV